MAIVSSDEFTQEFNRVLREICEAVMMEPTFYNKIQLAKILADRGYLYYKDRDANTGRRNYSFIWHRSCDVERHGDIFDVSLSDEACFVLRIPKGIIDEGQLIPEQITMQKGCLPRYAVDCKRFTALRYKKEIPRKSVEDVLMALE